MEETMVRPSAVAGYFYPSSEEQLIKIIKNYIEKANISIKSKPKALISPHAGYIYSGPIAAYGYKSIMPYYKDYDQIILLGPSHFEFVPGIATAPVDYFETPLGKIPIDKESIKKILPLPYVYQNMDAHKKEHSLEVQLPFLQYIFKEKEFKIIPIAVGKIQPKEIWEILNILYNEKILIIVSSDLSHYYDYNTAKLLDEKTANAIEELNPYQIHYEQACGRVPIQGLLLFAKQRNLTPIRLDLRNSGDTAGDKRQVVGYGSWCFI
jgi:AmmeMemoRadiSam system protein B